MMIQIVTFRLNGITDAEYTEIARRVAPNFQGIPGLISKTWLRDIASNTYGGVYVWQSRQAMQTYKESELFHNLARNPVFEGVRSMEFETLETGANRVGGENAAPSRVLAN